MISALHLNYLSRQTKINHVGQLLLMRTLDFVILRREILMPRYSLETIILVLLLLWLLGAFVYPFGGGLIHLLLVILLIVVVVRVLQGRSVV